MASDLLKSIACSIVLLVALAACATGPHPAMQLAAKDFDCPMNELKRHEIYPNKQRVEGCGKEAVYVKGCSDYGVDGQCGWAKQVP